MSKGTKSTVVRDFGGGLNVVDDDLNLSSTFQTVLDNVHRGVDNTLSVRWGSEIFKDLRQGTEVTLTEAITAQWTITSRVITIFKPAHGLLDGQHITFTSQWTNMLGLKSAEIIGKPLGVKVIDAGSFSVSVYTPAAATGSDAGTKTYITDDHQLAGNIVELTYYDDHLVVVDTVGEIAKINAVGTTTVIWNNAIAFGDSPSTPPGWSTIGYASSAIFKGQLIICNGVDKPVLIDFTETKQCTYLSDLGGDNGFVPICKYVCSLSRWLIMAGDPVNPERVHISATDASGVWEGAPAPNDGTHMDLNNTNSSSLFIRGINRFRNSLAVAFDDTVTMIELGIFNGTAHEPKINDSISRHGAISHKSMIFLGFDLLMADAVGIPAFAKSQFDSSVIPSRMSEFIAPLIQQNINRLSPATLERDVWSVYSTHDNRYMLFVPNYDNIPLTLPNDPIYFLSELIGTNRVLLHCPNHGMEEGDLFTLSDFFGQEPPVPMPNPCRVDTVVNNNVVSFLLDSPHVIESADNYGGSQAKITRLKTETTVYAFTYNKGLKIKAWSRYRGWSFNTGCTTLQGRVFAASDHRIWRLGNRFDPIFADYKGTYDAVWAHNTIYTPGQRIRDEDTKETYTCIVGHTSPVENPFSIYRDEFPYHWKIYPGEAIKFQFELPWADFDKRDFTKITKTINIDAKGTDRFFVEMYLDYYYSHKITGLKTPLLAMSMMGGDKGGYGVAEQPFGSGRLAIRQRQWPWEARGKLFKLRVYGATTEPLSFVAFIFSYNIVGRKR